MSGSEAATPFDPLLVPLAGQQLIEASAGTGKTYSIAGLFLRLVAEAGLPVERILVVTYTNAATAELRDRIRRRLQQLREALRTGASDDPLLGPLLAHLPDHAAALRRVEVAVLGFDTAAVHTIHAFCQRALTEHAFASGVPFERELVPDPSARLRAIVQDCWRREVYRADPRWVAWLLARKQSPAAWQTFLAPLVGKPYLAVRVPPPVPAGEAEAAVDAAFADIRRHCDRKTVTGLLLAGDLNAASYKAPQVESLCDMVEAWIEAGQPPVALPERFDRFTPEKIARSIRKGRPPPAHAFFDACATFARSLADLEQAYLNRLGHLRGRLLVETREALETAKLERREHSYDDLLLDLDAALQGAGGERLAAALRERYAAALVDEFQDTDPVQYRILRTVYDGEPALFLVGDPKQAIYRFRGADVFAYLAGGEEARQRHTLAHNWRSVPALVAGVNALFSRHEAPFVLSGIRFQPARAADRSHPALIVAGERANEPPLRLWQAGDLKKGGANNLAAQATAAEIARLLAAAARGEAHLDGRPLAGGDIAVLVPTHRQGGQVREQLRRLNVGSVQLSGESVFATREAEELARLLAALAEPAREPLLRAALLTDLLGGDGLLLERLAADEARLEAWLERTDRWHRQWREQGLLPALRNLFEAEGVAPRLLALPDGERRLTNTLHLAELLQEGPVAAGLGPPAILKWLAARMQRAAGGGRAEEDIQELRLESDENLVNIVTVHRSKGLQYPVVFCPFLWDAKALQDPGWVDWHDPQARHRPVLDLGSPDYARALEGARHEALAESVRLAYVALTRAEQRCYVFAPAAKDVAHSALGWLLLGEAGADGTQTLEEALAALAAEHADVLSVAPPPEMGERVPPAPPGERAPAARVPAGPVRSHRTIGSFSSLARGHAPDRPDHDAGVAAPVPVAEAAPPTGIFAFPRGARAGTCLHAVFENLDFQSAAVPAGRAALEQVAEARLRAHGFNAEWTGVVADMVQRVLATPLSAGGAPLLAEVPLARCLHELEFYYPVRRLPVERLGALMQRFDLPAATGEGLPPLEGFLKGYLDLAFESDGRWYVLDWKSNWLGAATEDYAAPLLAPVMAREGYHLQYLLYVLALHRWLAVRLPGYDYERHFGGVRYLFLRGMEPAAGAASGVFASRPPLALVQSLDALMRGVEGST